MLIFLRQQRKKLKQYIRYNIGINAETYAGKTINHLHVHLIPRYIGDVDDPRGGVRNLKEVMVEYDG